MIKIETTTPTKRFCRKSERAEKVAKWFNHLNFSERLQPLSGNPKNVSPCLWTQK